MRIIKKSFESWSRAIEMAGLKAKMVRIPTTSKKHFQTGILMGDGVWITWPENLTEDEMKLYIDRYGDVPDLFELKPEVDNMILVQKDGPHVG